jgi:hypothetical protein
VPLSLCEKIQFIAPTLCSLLPCVLLDDATQGTHPLRTPSACVSVRNSNPKPSDRGRTPAAVVVGG